MDVLVYGPGVCKGRSQMVPGFLASMTGSIVVPFTQMGASEGKNGFGSNKWIINCSIFRLFPVDMFI